MTRSSHERLPVAVIGAGLMGDWHQKAAVRAGAKVVAVIDTNPARARQLASRSPGCATAASIDELAATVKPIVAHVCTPSATHDDVARAAVRRGCHVLIEKPMAANADATAALLTIARSAKRMIVPVHQCVFQRGVRDLAKRLETLGDILHVEGMTCSAGADGRPEIEADRIATEILPHHASVVERIAPGSLERTTWTTVRSRAGEWRASGRGAPFTVNVVISMAGRPTRHEMTIVGARATATLDLFHGFSIIEAGVVSRGAKIGRPFGRAVSQFASAGSNLARRAAAGQSAYPGLWELVEAFYAAILDNAAPPISDNETLAVARAVDAICRSRFS